jgi:hypothetical protein
MTSPAETRLARPPAERRGCSSTPLLHSGRVIKPRRSEKACLAQRVPAANAVVAPRAQ